MTDHLTIYLQSKEQLTHDWLAKAFEDAVITALDNSFEVRWETLSVTLNLMSEERIGEHLDDFVRFAGPFANRKQLKQIRQVQQIIGVLIEPGFDTALRVKALILKLAEAYDGMFFASVPQVGAGVYGYDNHLMFSTGAMNREFFPDYPEPTDASLERKARSLQQLEFEGILVLDSLPVIKADFELPETKIILERGLALLLLANVAGSLPIHKFDELVRKYGMKNAFSRREREQISGIRSGAVPDIYRISLTWAFESFWVLMWVLGYVGELGSPAFMCDPDIIVPEVLKRTRRQLVRDSNLRSADTILDNADLYYRYHWACVQSKGQQGGLNCDVVFHRRYALDWLVNRGDRDGWDEVILHT